MFLSDVGMVLWLSQPLIYANMLPVLTGRGGRPIDAGRLAWDGRPWFGPGKTWSGLIGGIGLSVFGTVLISVLVLRGGRHDLASSWGDTTGAAFLHLTTLASGALLGDLLKSFIKRRQGIDRGQAWPVIDQMDAVIGGLGLTWLCDPHWFEVSFLPARWFALMVLIVVYLIVHNGLSRLAYHLGWKTQPH